MARVGLRGRRAPGAPRGQSTSVGAKRVEGTTEGGGEAGVSTPRPSRGGAGGAQEGGMPARDVHTRPWSVCRPPRLGRLPVTHRVAGGAREGAAPLIRGAAAAVWTGQCLAAGHPRAGALLPRAPCPAAPPSTRLSSSWGVGPPPPPAPPVCSFPAHPFCRVRGGCLSHSAVRVLPRCTNSRYTSTEATKWRRRWMCHVGG